MSELDCYILREFKIQGEVYNLLKKDQRASMWIDQNYYTGEISSPLTRYELLSSRIREEEIHVKSVLGTFDTLRRYNIYILVVLLISLCLIVGALSPHYASFRFLITMIVGSIAVYFAFCVIEEPVHKEKFLSNSREFVRKTLELEWKTQEFVFDLKMLLVLLESNTSNLSKLHPSEEESCLEPPRKLKVEVNRKLNEIAEKIIRDQIKKKDTAYLRNLLGEHLTVCQRFRLIGSQVKPNQYIGNAMSAMKHSTNAN